MAIKQNYNINDFLFQWHENYDSLAEYAIRSKDAPIPDLIWDASLIITKFAFEYEKTSKQMKIEATVKKIAKEILRLRASIRQQNTRRLMDNLKISFYRELVKIYSEVSKHELPAEEQFQQFLNAKPFLKTFSSDILNRIKEVLPKTKSTINGNNRGVNIGAEWHAKDTVNKLFYKGSGSRTIDKRKEESEGKRPPRDLSLEISESPEFQERVMEEFFDKKEVAYFSKTLSMETGAKIAALNKIFRNPELVLGVPQKNSKNRS